MNLEVAILIISISTVLYIAFIISNKEHYKLYRKWKGGIWYQYEWPEIPYRYWTQEIQPLDKHIKTENYDPRQGSPAII